MQARFPVFACKSVVIRRKEVAAYGEILSDVTKSERTAFRIKLSRTISGFETIDACDIDYLGTH